MEKYLKELKRINTDKSKNVIQLIESIDDKTPQNQKREFIEVAKDLIEADLTANDIREILRNALKERYQQEFGPYIIDWSDTFVIFELESDQSWKADYSIKDDKVIFGDAIKVIPKTVYEPVMESKHETIEGNFVQLIEAATNEDGTIPIKVIGPGWGTSGYYPQEVLERDAGIYKEGTKMYWNHPTASEEIERPERSLTDLAGILVSEGAYDPEGASGPGVYAKAKVFGQFQDQLTEMAPFIGLSHIAKGKATTGEAEGQSGPIIESLNIAQSVDFVTEPGAGGEIIQLFESASSKQLPKSIKMAENKEEIVSLKEANKALTDDNQRMKEKIALQDAQEFVLGKLKESELPEITKQRLLTRELKNIVLDDKGNLDIVKFGESVKKAIKEETEYLASLSESGKITGMGSGKEETDDTKLQESNKSAFEELGLSEKGVELAVKGR